MTLSPLAKQLKLEAIQNPELDERDSQENGKSFSRRVQNFLRKCEKMQGSIFLVTHLDWIEEALIRIPANVDLSQSKYQHWNPASYMHFQVDHELWQLEEFGEIKC
jgi:broad specificity phosphatase PhoE